MDLSPRTHCLLSSRTMVRIHPGALKQNQSGTDPLIANLGKEAKLTDILIDEVLDDLEADPSLAIAESKKELKSLAKDGYNLIYLKPRGDLYVDGYGSNKGFGKQTDGGLIANLPHNSIGSKDISHEGPQRLDAFPLLELMTGSPTLARRAGGEAIGVASTESSSSTSLNATALFISSRAAPSSFLLNW